MITKKYYGQIVTLMLLTALVSACASLQLKTPEEKLFTLKATYLGFVSTAVIYKKEGRLSSLQERKLTVLFKKADTLLFAMDSYIRFDNKAAFDSNLERLIPLMDILRGLLLDAERGV